MLLCGGGAVDGADLRFGQTVGDRTTGRPTWADFHVDIMGLLGVTPPGSWGQREGEIEATGQPMPIRA